jgi:hypothetical protein
VRLVGRHLLAEHDGDQCFEDRLRPRDAEASLAPVEVRQDALGRLEPRVVVLLSAQGCAGFSNLKSDRKSVV